MAPKTVCKRTRSGGAHESSGRFADAGEMPSGRPSESMTCASGVLTRDHRSFDRPRSIADRHSPASQLAVPDGDSHS